MAKRVITKRIGDVLLAHGVITRQQLEQALVHQQAHGGLIGQALIQLGFTTEQEVALALTAQYGFPYLPLENYEIDDGLTAMIPERVAREYSLIPIDCVGNALTLAMADPYNMKVIDDVAMLTRCIIQAFVSTPSDIHRAIEKYYKPHAPQPPSPLPNPAGPASRST